MNYQIAVIPGDGIGPDVVEQTLKVMDKVVVPAGAGGKNRAIVTAVNVPERDINPDYFPLKRITEYDEEVETDGNN